MLARYRELWLVVAALVVSLAILYGFARAGWPAAPNGCIQDGDCFCEALRPGLVRQPANTFSNLGFISVGLALAAIPGRRRAQGRAARHANPMTETGFVPGLYALLVMLLGPGSMALHASMTGEGGSFDVLSMYLWIAFPIAYAAARATRLSTAGFGALYAALATGLAAVERNVSFSSDVIFGALIALFSLGEVAVAVRRRDLVQERRWLAFSALFFGAAFAIWIPSRRSDGPLCDPDSLLQGHAAWHLLCAASTWAIYRYYASERSLSA